MDFDRTREVLAALEREQVRYVVFGGVALNPLGGHGTDALRDEESHCEGTPSGNAERLRQRYGFEGD